MLFGTVGGHRRGLPEALPNPTQGGGGIGSVSAGIAEALITTAVGLGVAIIAVWFYNDFTARLDDLTIDIDETASELVDTILRGVRASEPAGSSPPAGPPAGLAAAATWRSSATPRGRCGRRST